MILAEYLTTNHDIIWDYTLQCGVKNGVIRLPEDNDFDITRFSHWEKVYKSFTDFGIKPIVIEPMPNALHDHIKAGDSLRDECIEKVLKMFPIMDKLDIRTICFNWMAHIGWLRTKKDICERGGALVTGFDINDFEGTDKMIMAKELWDNYTYFINAVIYEAEKYNIKLALHPDDPPVSALGKVERIMISLDNIKKAISIVNSESLGITLCQATYAMMGEDLKNVVDELCDKIFFIHFRNASGDKFRFNETFHDNGSIEMGKILRFYIERGINVPIRADHVPLMAGEEEGIAGYTAAGRLYAIGYLKGLIEGITNERI